MYSHSAFSSQDENRQPISKPGHIRNQKSRNSLGVPEYELRRTYSKQGRLRTQISEDSLSIHDIMVGRAGSQKSRIRSQVSSEFFGPGLIEPEIEALPAFPSTEDILEKSLTTKEEKRKSIAATDWTGPDDPDNPHNWPFWLRVYHTTVPGLFGFVVTFGSSVYTPGYPEVMKNFNVSETVAVLGLSLYVLGLAFGPVLAAPISETQGRRVVYLATLPLAALFTLGAGFSNSMASLAVCRFFAGFFGSPVLAVGGGTNVDLWSPVDRAVATSAFLLAPFLGPALGPALGGFAAQYKGWRWTQWLILFWSIPVYAYSLGMKETYKKIIIQKRAKKLGLPPPSKGPTGAAALKILITVTLLRPVKMLYTEPIVFFFSMYTGFNFSVLFAFFDAFPIVFVGVYKFNLGLTGLTFLGIALGCSLAVIMSIIVSRLMYNTRHIKSLQEGRGGFVEPEHRLYIAMAGSFGVPMGLFWFAWTAREDIHWSSPVLATIPFAWGNLSIFTAAALYLVDVYGPSNGASALAANGLVRYISGAAFPLFTVQMYDKLGIGWASSLLGFLSVLMLPIPWVLFKYGHQIRQKSSLDTIKN